MTNRLAMRTASEADETARTLRRIFAGAAVGAVITASVISGLIFVASWGGSAAADETTPVKTVDAKTVSLAGRWTGQHYGYGRQGDTGKACPDSGCTFTFDIVACKDGWCGIAVNDDKSCGSVGVRMVADPKQEGEPAFKGKLELAKGSAAYTVEAWYRDDEGKPSLHFLGDTGPELLLMRRSFPFEADMARSGEATCKLDKATS